MSLAISRGLMWFAGIFATILGVIIVLLILVRSHDGPMEILSGGPFQTGELVTDVSDWSFMDDFAIIELQTMRPPRSRIMWLVVNEGRMYVISTYMNTHLGKAWKRWPRQLKKDNRAIVRADGKLYELILVRVSEGDIIPSVLDKFNGKYKTDFNVEMVDSGSSWLFELVPR